jgi:amino acid adenylation domain-containing protein
MNHRSQPGSHLPPQRVAGFDCPRVRLTTPFDRFEPEDIEQSIPGRFAKMVSKYRDRLAVKTGDCALTYAELDRVSNRVANSILAQASDRHEPVVLLLSHGVPAVVALLGVLKAGKFYVPLSLAHASQRDQHIIRDCGTRLLITDGEHLSLGRELAGPGATVMSIDELQRHSDCQVPKNRVPPDFLAFIIYTSGSTGEPKGVMQNQRNMLSAIRSGTNGLHINADDRITLLSSFSAGASASDIFGALLNGASLFPIDVKLDGIGALKEGLISESITIYHSVPSVFRCLAATLTEKLNAPRLRMLKLAGEAAYRSDLELYNKYFPDTAIFHSAYGSTEINVIRQFLLDKQTGIDGDNIPVGYETENAHISLVDGEGEFVGRDATGEIVIRSPHLSPGYWGKPGLTAAVFRPDPETAGLRAYYVGDMGRMSADGCLVHLGRKDFLVKIRGSGVNINEVELELLKLAGVDQAAVDVDTDPHGAARLVAFVRPETGLELTGSELRLAMLERLPEFMVPSRFNIVDELPLGPGGKINREALKGLSAVYRDQPEPIAPRNGIERQLAGIWRTTLGTPAISVGDSFLDVGGHSLIAARLVLDINRQFGTNFRPSWLVEAPTIEQMAITISEQKVGSERSIVAITSTGSRRPFFCVHGIGGEILSFVSLARHLGPDQPFYGITRPVESTDLRVEEMARACVEDLVRLDPRGPYCLGGYSFGGIIAFEMAQQILARGREVALLALIDTYAPGHPKPLSVPKRALVNLKMTMRATPGTKWTMLRGRIAVNLVRLRQVIRALGQEYRSDPGDAFFAGAEDDYRLHAGRIAIKAYTPKLYPGRIDMFRAQEVRPTFRFDPTNGWGESAAEIAIHTIPGNHFSILDEPNVQLLAAELGRQFRQASPSAGEESAASFPDSR